jgi:hypothetical protein
VKPEPCTSWTHSKQHRSVDLADTGCGGREGTALCKPGGVVVNVFDEESINRQLSPYRRNKAPIVVADLPLCRPCERAAAKLEG